MKKVIVLILLMAFVLMPMSSFANSECSGEHSWHYEFQDRTHHVGRCGWCGEEVVENHSWSDGRCAVCNFPCRHVPGPVLKYNPVVHYEACIHCESILYNEFHIWKSSWSSDSTHHWHGCVVCEVRKDVEEHDWDAGVVTKNPTYTESGVRLHTCNDCSAEKKVSLPAKKITGLLFCKAIAKNKSINIKWNKITGAEGYDIFFTKCKTKDCDSKYELVKSVKGNTAFSWTKGNLKSQLPFKMYVKAWVVKNGKKEYVKTSPDMHTYTSNGTSKYTVAKSVKVNKTVVTLKKNKTFAVKGSVVKLNKNKKLMPDFHTPVLRYKTSNSSVATVSKAGKILAKAPGTCKVYVYAHNGAIKTINVTVK